MLRLNIFSIPAENLTFIKARLMKEGIKLVYSAPEGEWQSELYISDPQKVDVPWIQMFADLLTNEIDAGELKERPELAEFRKKFSDKNGLIPLESVSYCGAYFFVSAQACYAISFGKAHFYLRRYCDHDFGVEVAKRLADEEDIKQKASKRFAGNRKKEIRSYTGAFLNVESGESVEYLQAAIIKGKREAFGPWAKFGSSLHLNVLRPRSDIADLLAEITNELNQPALFSLPRTVLITDEEENSKYDDQLLNAIEASSKEAQFAHSSYEMSGIDFIFGGQSYALAYLRRPAKELHKGEVGIEELVSYVEDQEITRTEVLRIKVRVTSEEGRVDSLTLKEALDFRVDDENVMLFQGRWVRFNEDYVDQINASVDAIRIEPTEPQFAVISMGETEFNAHPSVSDAGYIHADKDFSKIRINANVPIEAWDLQRDDVVYALKFGSLQKLNYVVDQAVNVLEIIRNKANVKKLDKSWRSYCLWIRLDKKKEIPDQLSELRSIIFKQKLDDWARRCSELSIEPRIKMSLKGGMTHDEHETDSSV